MFHDNKRFKESQTILIYLHMLNRNMVNRNKQRPNQNHVDGEAPLSAQNPSDCTPSGND